MKNSVATLTAFLSDNKNKIIMKFEVKSIKITEAIQSIIDSGAIPMLEKENNNIEILTPNDVKGLKVIVPLANADDGKDDGFACITISDIEPNECHGNWISCRGNDVYIVVSPELFKNLLILKMYSEGFGIITAEESPS